MPPQVQVGRDAVLADSRLAIRRNTIGRSARSFMFVGMRGFGKTVLLNEVQAMAEERRALTDFIKVASNEPLSKTIIATLCSLLLKLEDRRHGIILTANAGSWGMSAREDRLSDSEELGYWPCAALLGTIRKR